MKLPLTAVSQSFTCPHQADNQVGVFVSDFDLLVGDLTGHGVETALNLSKTHIFLQKPI